MAGSHTSTSAGDGSPDPSPLSLVSSHVSGLPERLAGRVDGGKAIAKAVNATFGAKAPDPTPPSSQGTQCAGSLAGSRAS